VTRFSAGLPAQDPWRCKVKAGGWCGPRLSFQPETKDFPSRYPAGWGVCLSMRTISVPTDDSLHREFRRQVFALQLPRIIARLRQAMEIPTGYQDETGFHYGVEPAKKDGQQPQD
jgi:hypothetical protein